MSKVVSSCCSILIHAYSLSECSNAIVEIKAVVYIMQGMCHTCTEYVVVTEMTVIIVSKGCVI